MSTAVSTTREETRPDAVARPAPGPQGHWLFGSVGDFRGNQLPFYERCHEEFGGVAAFRLGHRRLMLVTCPEGIEEVLVTKNRHFRKHYMLRLLKPLLGQGVLTSGGDHWLRQRRLMQPVFAKPRIAGYGEVFTRHAEREIGRWSDGERRDVHADMQRLTMGVAAETLLGVDVDGEAFEIVHRAQTEITEDFAWRFQQPLTLPVWVPTSRNRRFRASIRALEEVVYDVIRQKRERPAGETDDLLDRLLAARDDDGRGMSDRQLRDEVMTLFLAGHETTANALAWTFYLLGRHPHVGGKLREELDRVLGDRPATAADFEQLVYTRRVMKESMRLYPPAYAFGRESVRETEIAGFRVPKGWTVIVSQWVVHRDGRYYDRPLEFDPDRWTPELESSLPSYAYFPFGGGPRVCIGNTFAELESALVLATIHGRYDLELSDPDSVDVWPSITLRPRNGIPVAVRSRESRVESQEPE